jgi:hypothetical protein
MKVKSLEDIIRNPEWITVPLIKKERRDEKS